MKFVFLQLNFFTLNIILYQIIRLMSRLPMRVLYIISDIIFVLNYYIVGYRKRVVYDNLRNAFPEKSEEELEKIRKEFFRNFSDYIVEMVKAFTISEAELNQRMTHINQELFQQLKSEKKNVILLAGHIFNWEWLSAFSKALPQEHCHPVYRKLQSPFWEEKIKEVRNNFGNQSIMADNVLRQILKTPQDGNSIYLFVADQSPHISDVFYGLNFLNQKTPVFIGYDKIAQKLDYAFVFCEMKKIKRGYYEATYHHILPNGDKFEEYEVVRKFYNILEKTIFQNPANWLWSHKRWKNQHEIKKYEA